MQLGQGSNPSLKQQIARLIFQALTDTSTDQKGGRRPTALKVLYGIAASLNATEAHVNEVINTFRDADTSFILPPLHVDLYPDLVMDISHESLMRQWTRLREWVDEESSYSQVVSRLVQAYQLYIKGEKGLLESKELYPIASWYHSFNPQPAWVERYSSDYKNAFSYLEKSEKAEKRKKVLSWVVGLLAAVILLGSLYLFNKNKQDEKQQNQVKRQDFLLRGRSAMQYSDPLIGTLLIAEVLNLGKDGDSLLQRSNELLPTFYLKNSFKTIVSPENVAFSDNGDSLLLWNQENNEQQCHVLSLSNNIFAKTILNRPVLSLPGQDAESISKGLSKLYGHWGIDPSGQGIVIDEMLTLQLNVPNNYHSIYLATVSPDGSLIFTAGRSKTGNFVGNLYDLSTGKEVGTTMVHSDSIYKCTFNREGNKIMTWSLDSSIRIFTRIKKFSNEQGDLDFPVKQFLAQIQAVTGAELNKTNNGFLPIPILEYKEISRTWKQNAEAHYKNCRYKSANYWAHCFPEKASLYPNQ